MLKFITILLNRLPIRVDCHVDDTMALNHNTGIRYLRKSNKVYVIRKLIWPTSVFTVGTST